MEAHASLQKATETRQCVRGLDPLQEGTERPLSKAVKLQWRPQDAKDARTIKKLRAELS